MLGFIAGDIIGSRFEHQPHKSKDFELFVSDCRFTDDTVLSVAVAETLLDQSDYALTIKRYFRRYPSAGYGARFTAWGMSDQLRPYFSFGNGSAMRVGPVGWFFDDLSKVLDEAARSSCATHDHPEGVKGAQAVAVAVFWARQGMGKDEIRSGIEDAFGYDLSRTLDSIRPGYHFDVTCQRSVPEAIIAFLEAESLEDAIRNAISLGGDADTQAAIAGGIAEAFWGGVPAEIERECRALLDRHLLSVLDRFSERVGE
jgi:ADP-ribosylglycohydrolase